MNLPISDTDSFFLIILYKKPISSHSAHPLEISSGNSLKIKIKNRRNQIKSTETKSDNAITCPKYIENNELNEAW